MNTTKMNASKVKQNDKVKRKEQQKTKLKKMNQEEVSVIKYFQKMLCAENWIQKLFTPTCPSSIGIARIMFGFLMVVDIPDERGLSEIDLKYGNPMKCHFPLFNWLSPLPLEYMGILYFIMWLGAAGICLGYKFRLSCIMFTIPYWYIFLLDKTTWNNHSYLYGLVSILFTFSSAHHTYSIDSKLNTSIRDQPVPLWNYAVLRFQFFLLYFYAGVKKFDSDWLGGHSMTRLGLHWVFDPFRLILTDDQIDLWIIHVFGFLFDLTVGFFLLAEKTRPVAILFSSAFHLMNSRIFHIGQFPYVCLCMTPIFCNYDWPDRLWNSVRKRCDQESIKKPLSTTTETSSWNQKLTLYLLLSYAGIQLFLPYSHFITKGYNNWTNGLYGYSWDMMVHNWDSILTVIKVVDNDLEEEFYLDPEAWVENLRYTTHGDMLVQYAQCVKRNLQNLSGADSRPKPKFENISVYIDVWCSLNGRFQQRMFDPRQDLMKAEWSPFQKITWLLPLISDLTPWRKKISELEQKVVEHSNDSGVVFVADFPGLRLDNYISSELTNVTITVLHGNVILEKKTNKTSASFENVTLNQGDSDLIVTGEFHTVYTTSVEPSCYMYFYLNRTLQNATDDEAAGTLKSKDTFLNSVKFRIENLIDSFLILRGCFNRFGGDLTLSEFAAEPPFANQEIT